MSVTEGLRKGMVIRHEGQIYSVLDFHVAQSGKQRPTVHLKLRELSSGKPSERTLNQIGSLQEVPTEHREMQYLYAAGKERVFMDSASFEQFSFDEEFLGSGVDFLSDGASFRFLVVEGNFASIELPAVVTMAVAVTAPVEHAGGSSNVFKEATMDSGLTIRVPLFIKKGDRLRVKTDSREYVSKEH